MAFNRAQTATQVWSKMVLNRMQDAESCVQLNILRG